MVEHKLKYQSFIKSKGVGANDKVADSVKSYVSYLESVSRHLNITISPRTLSSEIDIENISKKLKRKKVAEKSIKNYGSAMRQYINLVKSRGL